jgi:peptide/nickel transport system permease protein
VTQADIPALRRRGRAGELLATLRRTRFPWAPAIVIAIFVLMAALGEHMAPGSATQMNLRARFIPPVWQAGGSWAHVVGTDMLGRDLLSRIIVGARTSLVVAVFALLLGGGVGATVGLAAGYAGGRLDALLMRAGDATIAFPIILLAMLLSVVLGPSLQNVVISLGLVMWARFARVVRGEVLSYRERDFIALARVAGASHARIMFLHLLPNVANALVVMLTLQVGWVIIIEASLSFLGAGIPGPEPVWGSMIAAGRQYVTSAWWVPFFPGLAVAAVCLSFNLLGDWMREALDPKLRQAGD